MELACLKYLIMQQVVLKYVSCLLKNKGNQNEVILCPELQGQILDNLKFSFPRFSKIKAQLNEQMSGISSIKYKTDKIMEVPEMDPITESLYKLRIRCNTQSNL
jgi:hypothetical protein